MNEQPFYLENNGYRLYCIGNRPAGAVKCGVVLCHPFAEEKLWAQRVLVSFARLLARNGYRVLRMDYMGHGDSEGDFSDATIATRMADIHCALDHLKAELPDRTPLCLAGLRLGATLASIAAETRPDVDYLILWEPIINGETYMRQLFRINIATQAAVYKQVVNNTDALVKKLYNNETVNIDGYEIGRDFYEQLIDIKLLERKHAFRGTVLLVAIARTLERINKQFFQLNQRYANSSYLTVAGEPFWNNISVYCKDSAHLFDATLQWLEGKENDTRENQKQG
jgi:uncharacterized protein